MRTVWARRAGGVCVSSLHTRSLEGSSLSSLHTHSVEGSNFHDLVRARTNPIGPVRGTRSTCGLNVRGPGCGLNARAPCGRICTTLSVNPSTLAVWRVLTSVILCEHGQTLSGLSVAHDVRHVLTRAGRIIVASRLRPCSFDPLRMTGVGARQQFGVRSNPDKTEPTRANPN